MLLSLGAGGAFAAALYAFHPLPVTESAGQGHLDSLGIALLVASAGLSARHRRAAAGVAFAASVLTKYVSVAALPVLLRSGRTRFLAAAAALLRPLWTVAGRAARPSAGSRSSPCAGTSTRCSIPPSVRFMECVGPSLARQGALLAWKASHGHPPWTQDVFPFFYSAFFARVALAFLLVLALAWITWRVRDPIDGTFASSGRASSPFAHAASVVPVVAASVRRDAAQSRVSLSLLGGLALLCADVSDPAAAPAGRYAIEYVPFVLLLLPGMRRLGARLAGAEPAR